MILPPLDLNLEGWTVRVEPALAESKAWPAVRRELENQLYRIARTVPAAPLAEFRKVTIWANLNNPATPCMAYHDTAFWLRLNKMNPAMEKGVELGNADKFLSWTHNQPWMVLHELAHAYHHRALAKGFGNPEVKAAYDAAIASKKYDKVLRWNGTEIRHYALKEPAEYFAETTEAYFGQNDYFPFVAAELQIFDPAGYTLMTKVWGKHMGRP